MQSSILSRTAARQCLNTTTRRQLSSSSRRWQAEATSTPEATVVDAGSVRPKKPIGGFRGGVFGFLLGFSVASAYASYRLLEEYKIASALLQASVEELQASTDKISTHIRRIETVEKNLKALSEASATKEDSKKSKAELKKLYVSPSAPGVQLFKEREDKKLDVLILPLSLLLAAATVWALLLLCLRQDGLHVEFLDLRAHVWGMQQDLHALVKKEATSLRPT
ncbi:hypothetical protein FRC04_001511 [Tulasnella sp. 424]|nr:hypothetical protein FRC04_001511 [Tulasnella sp. 424]